MLYDDVIIQQDDRTHLNGPNHAIDRLIWIIISSLDPYGSTKDAPRCLHLKPIDLKFPTSRIAAIIEFDFLIVFFGNQCRERGQGAQGTQRMEKENKRADEVKESERVRA